MRIFLAALLAACGSPSGGDGDGDGDGDGFCGDGVIGATEQCDGAELGEQTCLTRGFSIGTLSCSDSCFFDTSDCFGTAEDNLETATGCEGVFNPDQVLRYHVEGSLAADGPGTFRCEDGPTLNVEVETKRGGGFKIDTNEYDDLQTHFGLKKLVFDTGGVAAEPTEMVRQFLAWRMMRLSGAVTSRAALAEVYVNGSFFGTLVVIEAVDKTMMKSRFDDNDGWLYKKSGGLGDGLKTHESDGLADANPYDDYLCFFDSGNGCPVPGDIATELPNHLRIDQFLRVGAVNALIANSDSPIFKDNNYYYYDWPGKRVYLPWDLDTVMKDTSYALVQDVSFASVLFTHWQGDYEQILAELMAGPLAFAAVQAELDRVRASAGEAIGLAGGDAGAIADTIEAWWSDRFAAVQAP